MGATRAGLSLGSDRGTETFREISSEKSTIRTCLLPLDEPQSSRQFAGRVCEPSLFCFFGVGSVSGAVTSVVGGVVGEVGYDGMGAKVLLPAL